MPSVALWLLDMGMDSRRRAGTEGQWREIQGGSRQWLGANGHGSVFQTLTAGVATKPRSALVSKQLPDQP